MKNSRLVLLFGILISANSSAAMSDFSAFTPELKNRDLKEQLEKQPQRKANLELPVVWAVDFNIFKQWGSLEYYHGPGYWIEGLAEYKMFDDLTVNGRLIFQNGSTSYGYMSTSSIFAMPAVIWKPAMWGDMRFLTMRFFDMGRQTLGTGLLIEDQEMSGLGVDFALSRRAILRFLFPGTSVINESGDLFSSDLTIRPSRYWSFGATSMFIISFAHYDEATKTYISPDSDSFWGTAVSTFLKFDDTTSYLELEGGFQEKGYAGRAAMGHRWGDGSRLQRFSSRLQILGRHFSREYLGNVGASGYTAYRPYNLYDRTDNNPRIFLQHIYGRSEIATASVEAQAKLWTGDRHFIETKVEYGQFKFDNRLESYTWAKGLFGYSPYVDKPMDYIGVSIANYGMTMMNFIESQSTIASYPLLKETGPNLGVEAKWGF